MNDPHQKGYIVQFLLGLFELTADTVTSRALNLTSCIGLYHKTYANINWVFVKHTFITPILDCEKRID